MALPVACFSSSVLFFQIALLQVRVGSTLSMTKLLENATPQGNVLSPVLFSLMINDLPDTTTSPCALYADDFCFWEHGSDITILNQLCLRSLTKLCKWCDENGFKISGAKSDAVLFTKKTQTTTDYVAFTGQCRASPEN